MSERTWRRRSPRHLTPITDLATHPKRYVLIKPLAKYLECDPRTILRMIAVKTLTAVRVGRQWRIPIEVARAAFHEERQVDTSSDYE